MEHNLLLSDQDPRNDEDYDTFEYGTEPLPGDTTWRQAKQIPPVESTQNLTE